ncbi:MAG: AAA family ATPase [Actinobacteria bacterium]|nr:AAA family ATPase [Actinomycetota bacterium]
MSYRTSGLSLPLHRTSSMVSELAPVVLYLRYILDQGDLLLIEEPESHLHPESQLRVARAIALAGSGLWVALTTHSDYLLQSISNAIRATSAGQQEMFTELAGPSGLPLELVSAYLFTPSSDEHGTDTSRLAISREMGISDEEFARVTELLYKETVTLDRLVQA